MRIDLETHYSVHPFLPSPPPLLSKNETYFEACSLRFTTPKKRRGPRRKANFNFRRDNRPLPPLLPPPSHEMPALSLVLGGRKWEGRYCRWQSTTVGQRNELYRAAGIFHWKDLVRQREKTSRSWHWGRGTRRVTTLSLSLSLSLSLVFFGRSYFHSCMERSIDLITCRFSGNQILSYVSFQAMNDRTIQFSFFWFKVLRFFSRECEISEILNVSLFI